MSDRQRFVDIDVSDRGPLAGLPRPLAFVLSGGAASGASQVGMLLALQEAGVAPDLVVGTSVGAINGVMVAADPAGGADCLSEAWRALDREGLLGSSNLRCLPRLIRTRRHLFPADGLTALIQRYLVPQTFAELRVRFAAIATRTTTGTAELLETGRLESALLASTAIPGVFPRVEIDGEYFFDGGITANVPVRQAACLGARSILVLNASPAPGERVLPANIAETLQYAVSLLMRSQASAETWALEPSLKVLTLPQTSPADVGVFDFGRAPELIDRAFSATSSWLAEQADGLDSRCVVTAGAGAAP